MFENESDSNHNDEKAYVHVHKMCKAWFMRHICSFSLRRQWAKELTGVCLSAFCMSNFLEFINIQLASTDIWVYEVQNPPPLCAIKQQHLHPSFLFILLVFWNMRIKHCRERGWMSSEARLLFTLVVIFLTHRAQTAFNGSCKTQKHAQRCGHSTSQRAKHRPDAA